MADKKISALSSATSPLAGTEVLPIVQSNSTVKVSVSDLTAGRQVNVSKLAAGGITNLATIGSPAIGSIGGTAYDSTFVLGSAFLSDATSQQGVQIGWNTANKHGIIASGYGDGTAGLELWNFNGVGWANQVTITQTGNIAVKTAGRGIDFSANTHAAGMTSELLNDYEEGTWTPIDFSGAGLTLTVVSAKYTRIGNIVTVQVKVTYPATVSALGAGIAGLPFTPATECTGTYYSGVAAGPTYYVSGVMYFADPSGGAVSNATLSVQSVVYNMTYAV